MENHVQYSGDYEAWTRRQCFTRWELMGSLREKWNEFVLPYRSGLYYTEQPTLTKRGEWWIMEQRGGMDI